MRYSRPAPPLEQAGVHPGRDWFMVLSGTAELRLVLVDAGQAEEFSTMTPHGIGAHGGGTTEILMILTQEGRRVHAVHDERR